MSTIYSSVCLYSILNLNLNSQKSRISGFNFYLMKKNKNYIKLNLIVFFENLSNFINLSFQTPKIKRFYFHKKKHIKNVSVINAYH